MCRRDCESLKRINKLFSLKTEISTAVDLHLGNFVNGSLPRCLVLQQTWFNVWTEAQLMSLTLIRIQKTNYYLSKHTIINMLHMSVNSFFNNPISL